MSNAATKAAAIALGTLGGHAAAKKLTKKQKKDRARHAALCRWGKSVSKYEKPGG